PCSSFRLSSLVIRTAAHYRARRFIVWLCAKSGARARDTRFTMEGCMEISLAGRAAVVTGGSKGVGLGVATRFAASGADVAIIARGREALDQAVKSIGAAA